MRFLHFLFGHWWLRVPFSEPVRGTDEWGLKGQDEVNIADLSIRRRCLLCAKVQKQTGRKWRKNLTYIAVWEDELV
jgi:hypothetical protein